MSNLWTPTLENEWVVPVVGTTVAVLLEVLIRPLVAGVSLDVMEFCDLHTLRETARSIWTNLGVTAALLLSISVGMLQADPISPFFEVDSDMREPLMNIQLFYNLFTGLSLLYNVFAIMSCVIYLCYVDPLTNQDAIKFFIANPASIGQPVLSTVFGSLYMIVAMVLFMLGTSGLPNAIVFGLATVIILIVLICEIIDKSRFDPSGQSLKAIEWQWPLKEESEWPTIMKRFRKNKKALRVFKKMAKSIEPEIERASKINRDASGNPIDPPRDNETPGS